jgi:hypothetical protein
MPESNHSYNFQPEVPLQDRKEKACTNFEFKSTFKYIWSGAVNNELITP